MNKDDLNKIIDTPEEDAAEANAAVQSPLPQKCESAAVTRLNRLRRPFRKGDILVYVMLALMIAAVMLAVFLPRKQVESDAVIEVYCDGRLIDTIEFLEGTRREITADGNVLFVLVVKDAIVSVEQSSCPDHLCEHMSIRYADQQIICLPHKVTVIIKSDDFGGGENIPGGGV